jgi:hypothetical protein
MLSFKPQLVAVHVLEPDASFRAILGPTLARWGNGLPPGIRVPGRPTGESGVRAELANVEAFRAALGDRRGTREDEARDWLETQRSELFRGLNAVASVGLDCDGDKAAELIEQISHMGEAVRAAEINHFASAPQDVIAAREELEKAQASERELHREIATLVRACAMPRLTDPEVYERARTETQDVLHAISRNRPATALQAALEQGARAAGVTQADTERTRRVGVAVARLWICHEPAKSHDVFAWRWARFQEGGGEIPIAKVATLEPESPRALTDSEKQAAQWDREREDHEAYKSRLAKKRAAERAARHVEVGK